jgi:predicted ATPase
LKEPRRQFHDRIADGLLARFPDVVANTPELVASHLSRAERFSEAVDHWKSAGLRAKNASSNQEAASHFEMALKYLEKEAPSPARDKRELELQTPLGQVVIALHGWASRKAGLVHERAFALTRNMDNPPQLFQIMFGLGANRGLGKKFLEGISIAKQMSQYADTKNDKAGRSIAHRLYGNFLFWLPDYDLANTHFREALTVYDELESPRLIDEYGHDPKALSLAYLAWLYTCIGFPDQGLMFARKALAHAELLKFPYVISHVHLFVATVFQILKDPKNTKFHAETALQIATQRGFSFLEGWALIFTAWAEHHLGEAETSSKMETAIAKWKENNSDVFLLWLITCHIDVVAREHRHNEAGEIIKESISIGERAGCKWLQPEFLRLGAVCNLREKRPDVVKVERTLLKSLELARIQGGKFWELRAAVSLARLWGERGDRQKAYDLLLPVYDWFTEGFKTADMKETKTLLDQLQ